MISFDYLIHNDCLLGVQQVEDIGIKLVLSLSFNNHIEFIICIALCTLGFIPRNTSDFDQANCLKIPH